MFPGPPDAVAVRAASTELPSSALHTGRPVAKFRKCVPIGFETPDVWYSVASGSVKSQVPVAWQVYFCTPIAWATRNSRLSGAYVRGSSASPGAVCGAGAADAAAVTRPHNARTVAQATIKREKRCFVVMEFLSRVELRDPRQRTTRWDAAEYRRATVFKAGSASVEARLPAEGELAEELVGAVCAEGVHEGDGADVAIGARERAAVQVAGSAGEGERAVDDADGRLTDERLRGLGLREDACDALAGAVRRRLRGEVVVDQRRRAGQDGAAGRQVDDVLCRLHPRAGLRLRARACEPARDEGVRALGDAERSGRMEEAGIDVPLDVRRPVADGKAAAERSSRQGHVLERHRVAARGTHSKGVPVVVHDPAVRGARGGRRGAREVLPNLADGGREDDAVGGDLP